MSDGDLEPIGPLVERELASLAVRYAVNHFATTVVELEEMHRETGRVLRRARAELHRLADLDRAA